MASRSTHGQEEIDPLDRIPTSNVFSAVRFNSVMNIWGRPVSLNSTRRKVYALTMDLLTVEFLSPGSRSLTFREWPMSHA